MGPWYQTHLHQFAFELLSDGPRDILSPRKEVLRIMPARELEEDEFDMPGMPPQRRIPKIAEEQLKLREVFESSGRLHSSVSHDGSVLPLIYLYDFGVCASDALT